MLLLIITTPIAALSGHVPLQGSTNGVCFTSASVLNLSPEMSMVLNVIGILGICTLLILLNKVFSFIRAFSLLYAPVFIMAEIAHPYIATRLYDGTILCLVALSLSFILFSSYGQARSKRSIFMTFFVLSLCSTFQYAFIYLIPVFLIGFLQMRIMTLKGILAMIFGLIAPFWILLGMGIVPLQQLMPIRLVNVWEHLNLMQSGLLIASMAITASLTIVLMVGNMFQIMKYRSEIRAFNGFFAVLGVFTMVMMAIDYNNILIYLPMLNCCFAIQMAHFFTINKFRRRYILIFVLLAVCLFAFLCRISFIQI